ncbi:MAG: ABC transporter substrate-binding protein [Deltaproteobacteria bacterium RBG_16_54_11]|nr:MAG: ABC transporter substrate-binding protein [Deltaproteobacteria bacterium RBG_16_54_11]
MKKLHVLWIILLTALLVAFMSFPAGAQGVKRIKIGVIGPMKYVQGQGHWNGALMAADEINAKGGIQVGDQRMKIELIKADSNEFLNITDATNAMERLISRDKVNFVVGGFRTEAVFAMQDIACEHKVIFIGCGAAHNELCARVAQNYAFYKYWFRESPFNSSMLARTSFIHLGYVAGILKEQLNIPKIKVAVVAEKAMWADAFTKTAEMVITQLGMELVGTWRPSPVATDVSAELSAIQRSGAQIIFTIFSSSVGIPFARQAGELKIPAVQVGINVEAAKDSFWQATNGKGNYVFTSATFCRGVESNENTKAFVEGYIKRFGETPAYTAATYGAIKYGLVPSIEKVGSLNPDQIVAFLEEYEHKNADATVKYMKDPEGKPLHDITWGPGYATGIAIQWQDGKMVGVWPYKWKVTPDAAELTYKGIVPYKIPPWVIEKYKK